MNLSTIHLHSGLIIVGVIAVVAVSTVIHALHAQMRDGDIAIVGIFRTAVMRRHPVLKWITAIAMGAVMLAGLLVMGIAFVALTSDYLRSIIANVSQ